MLSNGRDIPYLGLKVVAVTDNIAVEYGLPHGIYIKEVRLDSPAFAAGLQNGDVIVELGGKAVSTVEAYEAHVLSLEPGTITEIIVKRQGMDEYLEVEYKVSAGILQ